MRAAGAGHILIVEPDVVLRTLLSYLLTDAGSTVRAVDTAGAALEALAREPIDLLVLEAELPGMDGVALCQQLRLERNPVLVLVLSARPHVEAKVAAFDAGADDYLTRPFEPRELLARVRALLRRQSRAAASVGQGRLEVGGLTLDLGELSVRLPNGEVVELTPTETRVLECLMLNAGRVVTREYLLREAWGQDYEAESNQVDVYIRRLRRKIETDPTQPRIRTVRGLGYRFEAPQVRRVGA